MGVAELQFSRKTAKNAMRMVRQYHSPPSPVFIWGYSRTHSILGAAGRWIRNGAVSTPFLFRQDTQPIMAVPLSLYHLPLALVYARAAIGCESSPANHQESSVRSTDATAHAGRAGLGD